MGVPRGSCGSGEVREALGGIRGVLGGGGRRDGLGGSRPGKGHFLLFGGWICQSSNDILLFSVLGRFVKRSVVIELFYVSLFFGAYISAKQWCEYVMESTVCWTYLILHLQISMNTWCRKHDFGRWILRRTTINFEGNPCSCFNNFCFAFCKDFEETAEYDAFAGKWKSE